MPIRKSFIKDHTFSDVTLSLWAIRLEHMKGSLNLQNVASCSPNDTSSPSRRPESSEKQLCPPHSLFWESYKQKYILWENSGWL